MCLHRLNGTGTHSHAYWIYTGDLRTRDTSFTQDTLDGTNDVRIKEVPLSIKLSYLHMMFDSYICMSLQLWLLNAIDGAWFTE